jgi:hypothetical protein
MIPELVNCLDRSVDFLRELVSDLSDEEMTLQPAGVPNHAAWTLGHVIFSCQAIAGELGVTPWLPVDWESCFGSGSLPGLADSAHSGRLELLTTLEESGRRLKTALLRMDESALTAPLPDENAREILPTLGHALLQIVAAHTAFHVGQLSAWRRAIGRRPKGVFI